MHYLTLATLAVLATAAPVEQTKRGDAPNGNKKGLCYNDNNAIGALSKPGSASWAYNWAATSEKNAFQYIPMMWDLNTDKNAIMSSVKAGAPWVLGFNEPDECNPGAGGACITPQAAQAAWGNDMWQFQGAGAKLVCPAVTSDSSKPTTGFNWLGAFAAAGAGGMAQFRCDAQALHWYGDASTGAAQQAAAFKQYVQTAHDAVDKLYGRANVDLWFTEFAPQPLGNPQLMADFLNEVIPFLDSTPYVARYSPLQAEKFLDGANLNAAGNAFVGAH